MIDAKFEQTRLSRNDHTLDHTIHKTDSNDLGRFNLHNTHWDDRHEAKHYELVLLFFSFVFWVFFCFSLREIQKFIEVASGAILERETPTIRAWPVTIIDRDPVHKREGWGFRGINFSSSYDWLSSVAAIFESEDRHAACCILCRVKCIFNSIRCLTNLDVELKRSKLWGTGTTS